MSERRGCLGHCRVRCTRDHPNCIARPSWFPFADRTVMYTWLVRAVQSSGLRAGQTVTANRSQEDEDRHRNIDTIMISFTIFRRPNDSAGLSRLDDVGSLSPAVCRAACCPGNMEPINGVQVHLEQLEKLCRTRKISRVGR